jgi:transposase
LQADLKTGKAYAYRIHFQEFWECADRDQGAAFFANWYRSAIHTTLRPIKQVARTLKNHLDGLLNYFSHPITNAVTEGLNSMIQKLKTNARGFRSFDHYRTRILFYLGGLDLAPQTR